jgi:hypothetical protein
MENQAMVKRTHKGGRVLEIVKSEPAPATQPTVAPEALTTSAPAPKTVVKVAYKHRYQDRAKARGLTDKASKRGNGDWLQRELQAETVGKDGKLDLERFIAIMDANGVDYSRWKREGHGWEGRFRMSGSLVLRGIVGKTATFRTPEHTVDVSKIASEGDAEAQAFLAKWAN